MNLYERNQKQRTFFNEKIDSYDDVHSTYMETKKTLGDSLDKETKKILDLGAGTGLELIHVFELFPSAEVTVIDITENMLEELLSEFSISHLRKSPALALSGGERRRLEIARALASKPSFILLDEPLAGIDPIAVGEIRSLVAQLKNRGLGVLITDHNVRETLDIIDRAYILHGGTVLMEGTPEEIVANEDVRKVYLGDNFSL